MAKKFGTFWFNLGGHCFNIIVVWDYVTFMQSITSNSVFNVNKYPSSMSVSITSFMIVPVNAYESITDYITNFSFSENKYVNFTFS